MKKSIIFSLGLLLGMLVFGYVAHAQSIPSQSPFWISGSYITPTPLNTSLGLKIPSLTNQNCLGTDSTGVFGPGTCSGGGGGGGGSGNVATSSSETSGDIPFWTSTSGTPATLSGGLLQFQFSAALSRLTVTNSSTTALTSSTGYFTTLASTTALTISDLGNSATSCLHINNQGVVSTTGSDCSTGSGTLTQINTIYPILGGPITTTGTISTAFGTTSTWGIGNNGLVMTGATGIPFSQATSSPVALSISGSAASVVNSITFNSSGSGGTSPQVFNGSSAETISYNTIGAQPTIALGAGTVNSSAGNVLYVTATSSVTNGTGISFSGTAGALIGGTSLTITNSGVTSNAAGTGISVSGATGAVTITNTGVTSLTAGTGISLSGSTGGITVTNTGSTFAYPFTVLGLGTSSPIMLLASTTIGNGTVTGGLTVSGTASTTNFINTSITSALGLFNAQHQETAYGGASACSSNNWVTTISAVGGTSCGTIGTNGLTLSMFPTIAANTVIGNLTGATATPTAFATSSLFTFPWSIANGGTGQTSALAAFNALSPMTTSGDIIYGGASGSATRLGIGTAGFILASLNGIPTWIASTTVSNISAFKQASNYATTGVLPANTYLTGVLTEVGTGALTVDGASPTVGQRILVKNEATQTNNGIYTVTATGSGIAAYVLTRATDFNTSDEIYPGVATYILSGTANGDTTWVLTTPAPVTLDSSNLTFTESANGNITLPLSIANGGTSATSFTTSGNAVYYNGSALTTALTTASVTTPYASTTAATIASEINIPHSGTVPTMFAGDIYDNTNSVASSSIAFADASATHNLFAIHSVSSTIASSTLVYDGAFGATGSTTLIVANPLHTTTIRSIYCTTDTGTAWVGFGNGTATTTEVQCSVAGASATVSSNNVFNGRQKIYMEIGHNASAPNNITPTVDLEDSN